MRFADLGVCKISKYEDEDGPGIVYFKSPIERKKKLLQYLNLFEAMSSCSNNFEKAKIVEVEVQNAIMEATGKRIPKL